MDESLARLAVEEVWQEKDVKIASAVLDHPLTAKPVISIKSSGAKENLESAFKAVEEKAEAAIKAAKAI
ncbi:hypothetical protein HY995_05515 [Candidatus Micrarchaeota archaeon]|nr:hypothetical protein [Candidatus Micrarchaeota archaeon]MBI5177513.1 hypothetical protein [Candidatus Micrarchaeota archaeon]